MALSSIPMNGTLYISLACLEFSGGFIWTYTSMCVCVYTCPHPAIWISFVIRDEKQNIPGHDLFLYKSHESHS